MALNYFQGTAYIVKGDPTQAAGAGMVDLGETFEVTISPSSVSSASGSPSGQQLADGTYGHGVRPTIQITYHKALAEAMAALLSSAKVNADSGLDFRDEIEQEQPETLAIIPVGEVEGAIDSDDVFWFPAVQTTEDGDFTFSQNEGDNAQNNYTVTLRALKRLTDQNDTAIPKGSRIMFRGSPNATSRGLTWSLPSAYSAPV